MNIVWMFDFLAYIPESLCSNAFRRFTVLWTFQLLHEFILPIYLVNDSIFNPQQRWLRI